MTQQLLLDKLAQQHLLSETEFAALLAWGADDAARRLAMQRAAAAARQHFGNRVFIRGLVEISSYCRNDCYYCGLRRSNGHAARYRLSEAQIIACCAAGYPLGFRTFVLQGGEDPAFDDNSVCRVVAAIKRRWPDCAVTLSLGERSRASYQRLYDAGADRYLLRHETADAAHYAQLHPPALSLENRMRCLYDLKEIGFQVGAGFMVGSPGQTTETLVRDLLFLAALQPQMVGVGPFLPASHTPFAAAPPGSAQQTLLLLAIIRLMLPSVLLPATTALGTAQADGRVQGVLAGANVIMPNLSPPETRKKYAIYDHKLATGAESAEGLEKLKRQMREIGYQIVVDRGDSPKQA